MVLFFKKWATADGIGYPDELNELNALAQCFTGGVEIVHVKGDGTDPLNREVSQLRCLAKGKVLSGWKFLQANIVKPF